MFTFYSHITRDLEIKENEDQTLSEHRSRHEVSMYSSQCVSMSHHVTPLHLKSLCQPKLTFKVF